MKRLKYYLGIPIIVSLCILFYFLLPHNLYPPFNYGKDEGYDLSLPKNINCHLKKVQLSKKTYDIPHDIQNLPKIQLRIHNDGIESGFSHLAGSSADENNTFPPFSHCVYINTLYPQNQTSNITHEVIDNNINEGIVVSFGTIKNGSYQTFTSVLLSVEIFSKMNNTNHYSLDEVMQNIADRYNVTTMKDGSIKMSFTQRQDLSSSFNPHSYYYDQRFSYTFAKLNDKEIFSPGVDFISTDNGKSWKAVVLKYPF